MGGHSLVAHQMLTSIRQTFAVTLPLKTIFESPTLSAFGQRIDDARLGPQKRPLPPLEPVSRKGPMPMSFAQQRMWLLHRLGTDAGTYNLCIALQMKGPLEPGALQNSIHALRQRHESLRTRFAVSKGQPVQIIGDLDVSSVPVVDLCSLPKSKIQHRARLLAEDHQIQSFDLEKGPLLRLTLLKLGPADHLLLLGMHHIITDGWSVGILIREMSVFYRAYALAREPQVPPLAIQYADYSQWQRQWLQGDLLARLETFWKNRLAGAAEFLDLPTDRPRPAVQTFAGNTLVDRVDATAAEGLRGLGRQCGTTLFMTLQAIFATLLSRYSGQRDVVLGTPVANRGHEALTSVIGFFVNTLVLRHGCFGDSTFVGFLKQVRKCDLEAFDHQEMPFEQLVEMVQPSRNLSYSPLFQVQISLNNALGETPELVGLKLTELPVTNPRAKWDLHLSVTEEGSELRLDWEYNTDLFDQSRIERMTGHFQNLLRGVVSDPHLTLSKLPFLSDGERRQIVEVWNQTEKPLPRAAGVLPQFEACVAKNPDPIAVTWGAQQISFARLNRQANELGAHLRALGMGPETSVGICMDRSVEMITALLAILKCGAAYVPLDPSLPFKRLKYMAADSDTHLILAARNYGDLLEPLQIPLVFPDQVPPKSADWSGGNLAIEVAPDHCAYILYTSGSTGQPKGVMVSHGGLANYLHWCLSDYAEVNGGGSPLHGSLGFDATLTALWPPLLTGSGLWIVPEEGELTSLAAALTKRPFDLVKLTPAHLNILAEAVSRHSQVPLVKTLVIGGEALFAEDLDFWRKAAPQTRLINEYGPTETVVGCCVGEVDARAAGQVSIGSPIINTQIYLLDPVLNPVPVGVTGELFIGGMGLGRGYRNRPGLTARCFVPNPFATAASVGSRLYRSGDLARYDSHGNIGFHGRRDHQIKIRGYRIELGEIETLIHAHGQVEQAAVLVCSGVGGDAFLVAYLRLGDPEQFSAKDLRRDLGRQLPDYMVPRVIHCLDHMPMTVNGKIDRQALAGMELDPRQEPGEAVAPRNQTETFLCACWSRLLQLDQVGVDDNFFQLGGHSLLAHQVLSRVRETLAVELPLKTLFECPTIRQLADRIIQARGNDRNLPFQTLKPVPREGDLPLSFAQQRLWILEQMQMDRGTYNVHGALWAAGPLNTAALEQSLYFLSRRHESLRTTFSERDGQPLQVIGQPYERRLPLVDLSGLPATHREAIAEQTAAREANRAFDLERGPLWHLTLLRLGEGHHALVVTMHHIVSDGWSLGVLIRELGHLYGAFSLRGEPQLPSLPIQYADYASWQRQWLDGDVLAQQRAYWSQRLKDMPPLLHLPTDRPRPAIQTFRGHTLNFGLDEALTANLKRLSHGSGTTLFMTLQAAFATLLARYSGQVDVVMGSAVANRTHKDLEPLIGFFINSLVLRHDFSENLSFEALLDQVLKTDLEAFANQDLPFEYLVEILQPDRNPGYSPLFQIMFILQENPVEGFLLPGMDLSFMAEKTGTAKWDMFLALTESGSGLQGRWEYNSDLFDETTVARMIGHFETLLAGVCADPECNLFQIGILTQAERDLMLGTWNDTSRDFPRQLAIHRLFEAQCSRNPEACAVVYQDLWGHLRRTQLARQ